MHVSTWAIILQEKLNQLEADLGEWRNQMALGYTHPQSGQFEKASSVQLRNTMRTDASEDVRKACWEVSCPTCCSDPVFDSIKLKFAYVLVSSMLVT